VTKVPTKVISMNPFSVLATAIVATKQHMKSAVITVIYLDRYDNAINIASKKKLN